MVCSIYFPSYGQNHPSLSDALTVHFGSSYNQHHLLLTSAYYQSSCNQPGTCSVGYRHYHHSGSIYASVESVALEQRLRKAGLKTVSKEFSSRKGIMSRYGDKMAKSEFFGQVSVLEGKP